MSASPKPEKLLLNARETAEMLGISTRLLWSETNSGNIPSVRIGARVLYPVEEIKIWLENRLQKR
jgi:predicted DNA-binding transcriptional regulator AlpA